VPNPESALNEEAGRLLLEHYDDYAKRARLYTSIQAKSGKNDFMALSKHNQENDQAAIGSVKSTIETGTVLMPLSNTSSAVPPTTTTGKKRLNEEQQENRDQKKQRVKKNDKKKSLRRL
jgi:ubiquitin-conjugating enzyme E2 S